MAEPWLPAEPMTCQYDTGVGAGFEEGITKGYLVAWVGEPGPAQMLEVVALSDGDGNVWLEPTGEWQETTVVDDARP